MIYITYISLIIFVLSLNIVIFLWNSTIDQMELRTEQLLSTKTAITS